MEKVVCKTMITLKGTPPSTSHIYKYRRTGNFIMSYMTSEGKTKKEEYMWEFKSQYKGKLLEEELKLEVKFFLVI